MARFSVLQISVVNMSAAPALLLALALPLAGASVGGSHQPLFVAVDDAIKLSLGQPTSERISGIVWKRGPNIVADWTRGIYRSYGRFKDRTTVDNTTGSLEISAGTTEDSGRYQVEVNDRLQDLVYQVEVINRVPKPTVWIQPLSCGPSSARCSLICDGSIEGAGPVNYSWTWGDEGWEQSKKELPITNNTAQFRTFSCRMENSVSRQESEPANNPFFPESSSSFPVAAVVCATLLTLIVGTFGLVIFCNWTKIRAHLSGQTAVRQTPPEVDGVALDGTDRLSGCQQPET